MASDQPTPRPEAAREAVREERHVASDVDVWSIRIGNEVVRLETTHELSLAVWSKLRRYVEVLKPEEHPAE